MVFKQLIKNLPRTMFTRHNIWQKFLEQVAVRYFQFPCIQACLSRFIVKGFKYVLNANMNM